MEKKLAIAICEHLTSSIKSNKVKPESIEGLEVAIQCISEAFDVDPSDPDQLKLHSIKPANLASIFNVFLNTQQKLKKDDSQAPKPDDSLAKVKAEDLKSEGNKQMAAKNYSEAIEFYSQAISLDSKNPIYFGNRAAAYSQISDHEKSLKDSEFALSLDSNYHKAYSRMGHAYFGLERYEESVAAYEKGLAADPSNASIKASLETAKQKLSSKSAVSEKSAMPDLSALSGMSGMPDMGGMDFGAMMNNPGFMQMASQMMSNPAFSSMLSDPKVSQMAQNMMKNPDALKDLMKNPEIANMAKNMMNK